MENNFTIVKQVLKNSTGYATLDYIAKKSRLGVQEVEKILDNNIEVRKSFIGNFENQSIYVLKEDIGLFKDLWKTFCYINSVKF